MYEGTLPQTGIAIGAGGMVFGLSWLIVAVVFLLLAGILLTRYASRAAR